MHPKMVAQQKKMKEIAAKWHAAGEPGKWINFAKKHLKK
jgi:hypothetical protein